MDEDVCIKGLVMNSVYRSMLSRFKVGQEMYVILGAKRLGDIGPHVITDIKEFEFARPVLYFGEGKTIMEDYAFSDYETAKLAYGDMLRNEIRELEDIIADAEYKINKLYRRLAEVL